MMFEGGLVEAWGGGGGGGLTALSLQRIYDIEGSDGLAFGVLGVCDGIADDALEEGLQNTARLFVDHW